MNWIQKITIGSFITLAVMISLQTSDVYASFCDTATFCGAGATSCVFTAGSPHYGCYGMNFGTANCYDQVGNFLSSVENTPETPSRYPSACYYWDAPEAYCSGIARVPSSGSNNEDVTNQYTWTPFCGKQVPQSSVNQLHIDTVYAKKILVNANGTCDNNNANLQGLKPQLLANSTGQVVRSTSYPQTNEERWQVDAEDDFTMTAPSYSNYTITHGTSATCGSPVTVGNSLTINGSRNGGTGHDVYWFYRDPTLPTPTQPPQPTSPPSTYRITGRVYVFNSTSPPDQNSCPTTGTLRNGVNVRLRRNNMDLQSQQTYNYQGQDGAFLFTGLTQPTYEICADPITNTNAWCSQNDDDQTTRNCFRRTGDSTGNVILLRGPDPIPPRPEPPIPTGPACIDQNYNGGGISFSWSDAGVSWIDISENFNNGFFNKNVGGYTTNGTGFLQYTPGGSPLLFQPNHTYNARVYNGQQSITTDFNISQCPTPTPTPPPTPPPAPTPTPPPQGLAAPTVTKPFCIDPNYQGNRVQISSTNANTSWVDIAGDAGFQYGFYNKPFSAPSITGPLGFLQYQPDGAALVLQPNTTYYARTYNGQQSPVTAFSIPACQQAPANPPTVTLPSCINAAHEESGVGISWSNPGVTYVDISRYSDFRQLDNKAVSGNSTTACFCQ